MASSGLALLAASRAAKAPSVFSTTRFFSSCLPRPLPSSLASRASPSFSGISPLSRCSLVSPGLARSISPCFSMQRRFLGNRATGPQFDLLHPKSINLREEARFCCRLFSVPALNYLDFKQGCCSLRVFLFLGMLAGVSLDLLLVHPPRSSFWSRFHVHRWPLNAERMLFPGKGSVFDYTKEGERVNPQTGCVQTEACASFLKLMYDVDA
uniref:Uncharacterized protein n=1 Tax=Neospora caninum (strain Liverpool) TaxID=572307 RepID=A0A0F7UJC0_NEOCL|nr:TPA: hypothetical protein BN1204_044197 [Neospora caninum Liverpool]